MWSDLRYGLRMLRKRPGFTLSAVIVLALGIGANTAIFSVVNAVLLRPLPYDEPEQLVAVKAVNVRSQETLGGASPADYGDWAAQSESFSALTAYSGGSVTLTGGEQPEMFPGTRVTEGFFDVFARRPALGRVFQPEDFLTSSTPTVVLSYRLWQRRFQADPKLVGQTITLGGVPTTVIGVMPPDFKQPSSAEVWTPVARDAGERQLRSSRYFVINGRLKPGVTLAQAEAELSAIAARLESAYPDSNKGWGVRLFSLQDDVVGWVRPGLLILLGAVGCVLLIACANVANLLLARGAARQKEMAIRATLGASRGRVARQLLLESLLLALLGGGVGLLLAMWGLDALVALVPRAMNFPRLDEVRLDPYVIGFTGVVSLLTGVLAGLAPGLQAARFDLNESLKESSKNLSSSFRMQRTRSLLVVAEVALTLLLLVGAGLLVRSFVRLLDTSTGFDAQNLLVVPIGAPMPRYADGQQRALFFRQMQERVASVPGVEEVTANSSVPLSFSLRFPFRIEGRPVAASDVPQVTYSSISPGYIEALGIPLLSGRMLTERDARGAPYVALINETMRRRFFPGEDPVGRRLKIDYLNSPLTFEIVGVVADTKQDSLAEPVGVEVYVSDLQLPWFGTYLYIRTAGDPQAALHPVKRAVWSLDPNQSMAGATTMEQLRAEAVARPRFYTALLGAFAAMALLLAAVGLYGVMSYTVAQRTHEIGVRMALGAQASDVIRLVIRQGTILALSGVVIGLAGAAALTRVMTSLLYEVSATDPWVFGAVALLLLAVAMLACYVPARRATRVDPLVALRYE